ncbi:MAG: hypothetical protein HFG34_03085 [Eubacterium sp.]|nr:hypothetical protein [Eubacterium sp.]
MMQEEKGTFFFLWTVRYQFSCPDGFTGVFKKENIFFIDLSVGAFQVNEVYVLLWGTEA